jgi:hypothetical protein
MPTPIVPVKTGDVVRLKKPHPCGANSWEIVRVGMDIGLRCTGCDRKVMLVRSEFDRRFRGFVERANEPAEKPSGAASADSSDAAEAAHDIGGPDDGEQSA